MNDAVPQRRRRPRRWRAAPARTGRRLRIPARARGAGGEPYEGVDLGRGGRTLLLTAADVLVGSIVLVLRGRQSAAHGRPDAASTSSLAAANPHRNPTSMMESAGAAPR